MKGLRRAVFVTFLVCGAFLGHEIAYALHFGVLGAVTRQSTGVHRYLLPASELAASLLLGLASLCLLLVVVLRSVVRARRPAPTRRDVFRTQAVLLAGQFVFYVAQECVEARVAHTGLQDLGVLLACGVIAQTIVALLGGWLFALVWAPVIAHYAALVANRPPVGGPEAIARLVGISSPPYVASATGSNAYAPRAPPTQLPSPILPRRA